ncbi:glycosyltransferase [Entomobacter blattae]|uniref:Glycosyl transferases group 1 n=1 Tax=Entomobacter blattae TaxID=2762277 RepID=A0A7H1NR42_9PROT|nr:glycosyltransferase [Entomobacter blattae]QNT78252.1 Glycosyl transferases group 1 [Entomobacter blattae]
MYNGRKNGNTAKKTHNRIIFDDKKQTILFKKHALHTCIDSTTILENGHFELKGWAFIEGSKEDSLISVGVFKEGDMTTLDIFSTKIVARADVQNAYGRTSDHLGFEVQINPQHSLIRFEAGTYRFCLLSKCGDIVGGEILDAYLVKADDNPDSIQNAPPTAEDLLVFNTWLIARAETNWLPLWKQIDEVWYRKNYPAVSDRMRELSLHSLRDYYMTEGITLQHSPNAFFDEKWYRTRYGAVNHAVESGLFRSGFLHYCQRGVNEKYDPIWLFSEGYYTDINPDVSERDLSDLCLLNFYDHYLFIGDLQQRKGHYLYNPIQVSNELYRIGYHLENIGAYSCLMSHRKEVLKRVNTTLFFDVEWYLNQYPKVEKAIKKEEYLSALHHYLTNTTPMDFNPLEDFSESFYLAHYPDIENTIRAGYIRNGYEHFIKHGANEFRQPSQELDLKTVYDESPNIQNNILNGLIENPFEGWLLNKQQGFKSDMSLPAEEESRMLFKSKASYLLPHAFRHIVDFSFRGRPDVSLIMVLNNQFNLTLQSLHSIRQNYNGNMEMILVDSGSQDETRHLEHYVKGATILKFNRNIGFLRSCNEALTYVHSAAILYINNDIFLYPHAIANALKRLNSSPDIGLVGGKIIRSNGKLQEAGSIVWRDGTTLGYLRDENPNTPEANFIREVDFCSGVFLLGKSDVIHALKGFDPIFQPAYYEDTDLCIRAQKAGYKVVYDPTVMIEHMEHGSFGKSNSVSLIGKNLAQFTKQHADFLEHKYPSHPENALMAANSNKKHLKVLFFEDQIPFRGLGSGYVRSNDVIHSLVEIGCQVSVYPVNPTAIRVAEAYNAFPDTVEILINNNITNLDSFLKNRLGYFDLVWVGRTHNLNRLLPIFSKCYKFFPFENIVLDTEAVVTPRNFMKYPLEVRKAEKAGISLETLNHPEDEEEELKAELKPASYARQIVAVNDIDKNHIMSAGYDNVSVLGHTIQPHPTPSNFTQRRNFLFVGAIHDYNSPNYDSLEWLLEEVVPLLDNLMEEDYKLSIAGFTKPSINIKKMKIAPHVQLLGYVDNTEDLYDAHRVFVAPTRYAGGIPFKIHEAASYGIPVVCTSLLAEQIGWQNGEDLLATTSEDPALFAQCLHQLYTSQALWEKLRLNALKRIEQDCSKETFNQALRDIVHKATHTAPP